MARPTVSVALCTFNGARFLRAQVESIWAQSVLPDEIVAVDDGSADGTYDLLLEVANASPVPMRVERNMRNLGYVANFERALALTRHEIIFLCDQDDVWLEHKVEVMLAPFVEDPTVMMVHSDALLVDQALRSLGATLFEALQLEPAERGERNADRMFEWLLKRNSVAGTASAVRRTLVEAARPFEPGFVHDEWLALMACLVGRLYRVDTPLVLYRQHGRNQIGVATSHLARLRRLFSATPIGRHTVALRMQRLQDRLRSLGLKSSGSAERVVAEMLTFAGRRSALPEVRLLRVPGILWLLLSGEYKRYARGLRTALRDLVEPPRPEERRSLREAM